MFTEKKAKKEKLIRIGGKIDGKNERKDKKN